MENIFTILGNHGIEISEDKKKDFEKDLLKNYKTIAEFEAIKETLKQTQDDLKSRDTDLEEVRKQLAESGDDKEALAKANKSLEELQKTYEDKKKEYESNLAKKDYEFAVKEKISNLEFTSNAAKKAFTHDIIEKGLKLENGELLGFDDYVAEYKKNDEGVFKATDNGEGKPHFGGGTQKKNSKEQGDATLPTFI